MSIENLNLSGGPMSGFVASAVEYMVDAGQRSVLFLDVMRRRGDQYREHVAQTAPHVLQYAAELIIDGRKLDEPVNYALVRIIPPKGVEIDPERRPFIVIDPRAGHGPGIGGFKADSEIGVAMKAGHPCYFVGFLPEPMPGQTIERIARAEALFIEKVISLHPDADGKPCVIGNCQAGWAVMILAVAAAGAVRTAHHRRCAARLLGRRARQISDALFGRPARRKLADRADQRSRRRQVRWRLAGAEFREPEPVEHAVDQAVQRLFQGRHRGGRATSNSSAGGAATSI